MKLLFSILSVLVISVSGCISTQKPFSMDYKTDSETFHLTKSCIEIFTPEEKNNVIFIKIKRNTNCSKSFNIFWKKSVGKKVSVLFDKKIILKDVYTNAPIKTENGFYQAVDSTLSLKKIVDSLN
ncbi:hypothetical protein [Xenorhabdus thuongxuanensis]|uniref:Lipoprotein n=1 Tax=Xenorhabdus thuongxuanensis TaxID=1873484 RepID=A0A1Q5U2F4_9GAMM|nr:hypothetical protein [Xenorhabdus thuongxuanensis]OKP06652.1 hypothetical protein Xentx_01991 [Xenorhabdus thuongxuanensis]